eukprot:5414746-Pyramimonas_sp.AAC.1
MATDIAKHCSRDSGFIPHPLFLASHKGPRERKHSLAIEASFGVSFANEITVRSRAEPHIDLPDLYQTGQIDLTDWSVKV